MSVSVDQTADAGTTKLDQGPAKRLGSVLVGIVVIALKVDAYAHLLSDGRVLVLVILGLTALSGLLRGRPLRMAVASGAFVGVAVDATSVWARIAVGFVAVAALIALCVALGNLLQWLDERALT